MKSQSPSFPNATHRHLGKGLTMRHILGIVMTFVLMLTGISCEQSDDIEEIFTTRAWCFTGFCYTPNWNKGECSMLNIDLAGKNDYYLHTLTFHFSGTVDIHLPGCSLTAGWKADGTSRSFTLSDIRVVDGSLDKLSPFSRKFYDELTATTWYRGDALGLQLFNADEHYYLLFGPIQ